MSEYAGLQFHLCLTRRTLADEWFRALFQRLWTHGYSFSPTSSATWEAELEAPCSFVLGDGVTESGVLATFLARAAAESECVIDVSNGVSSLSMSFYETDSSPSDASAHRVDEHVKRLSYIGLGTNTSDTTPPGQPDRPPYLHAYSAFVRTCALLCEVLDPLYGLGYHLTQVRDQAGEDALADLDTSAAPDLLAGKLPNASAWFNSEPFQYIAPAYVTAERTLAWLASSWVSVERLATGGLLVIPTVAPYTQEASIAYTHLLRGMDRTLLILRHRHSQLAELTPEQLAQAQREGIDALTRAITIFASVNDQEGERKARFERLQLED